MIRQLCSYCHSFVKLRILFIVLIYISFACSGSSRQIRPEKSEKKIVYGNVLESLQSFDFENIKSESMDLFESSLFKSIQYISDFNLTSAENSLKELLNTVSDSTKRFIVKKLLVDLFFFKNDWLSIINLDTLYHANNKEENPLELVEAFSKLENETISFLSDSAKIKYEKSHSGTPILEVFVNGMLRYFWFDTGANYTVIASDIARESNIKPIKLKSSKALTATSVQINVLPTVLNEFRIGNLEILNHPAIIADESDLKLRLFGSNRITKVDGIIGWKAIQKMDITFYDNTSEAIIRKPKIDSTTSRNLFWLGIPFIKIYSEDNIPLIFGLDTGSEKSSITSNIFKKVKYDEIYSLTKKINSAGGWTFSESKNISRLSVKIDNKNIDFTDIGTTFTHQKLFIKLDGIIGVDLFNKNNVRIDILNGRFKIGNKN